MSKPTSAAVPALSSVKASASPAAEASWRRTTSAMGERHMLPEQTKQIRKFTAPSSHPGALRR
jgi:hypothetical protein